MNKVVALPALLLFVPGLAAQNDRIMWTDGTVTEKVRVNDFTWKEVAYTERGSKQTRSADMVASMDVAKVQDAFKRAFAATDDDDRYNQFRFQIDKINDKTFIVQFGYVGAARLLVKNGQYNEAFALLEKLQKDHPNSGFLPDVYRMKLGYYLAQGKGGASNAKTVAEQFRKTAISEAWPDGFVAEADLYTLFARAAAGEIEGAQLQAQLEGMVTRTENNYPNVAHRASVRLADVMRSTGNNDEAREKYNELLDASGIDAATRAQALVGLGYTQMASGDPSNTEPYRAALMSFLRVYLSSDVDAALKAEALYNASQAADKWGGPDSGAMARRLRGYLRRDYAESPWAKK